MKKVIVLSCCLLLAQIGAAKKTETNFYADDFANQSTLFIQAGKDTKSCQAVRITSAWYLTAAHCVTDCKNKCTLLFRLLQGPLEANVRLTHSSDKASRRVFIPSDYKPDTLRGVRNDMALIRFNPAETDYQFVDTRSAELLDYDTFQKRLQAPSLQDQREQWLALSDSHPVLRTVSSLEARHITVPVAVPVLKESGILFLNSEKNDFYYFPQLRYFAGSNFGVEQGMSGSGVVLPGGDIIGIVSASAELKGDLELYNEKNEIVKKIPYNSEKFYFTPINNKNKRFIENTIRSFSDRKKEPVFKRLGSDQSELTEASPESIL